MWWRWEASFYGFRLFRFFRQDLCFDLCRIVSCFVFDVCCVRWMDACVRACVRTCVRMYVRACVHACVFVSIYTVLLVLYSICVFVCVCVSMCMAFASVCISIFVAFFFSFFGGLYCGAFFTSGNFILPLISGVFACIYCNFSFAVAWQTGVNSNWCGIMRCGVLPIARCGNSNYIRITSLANLANSDMTAYFIRNKETLFLRVDLQIH